MTNSIPIDVISDVVCPWCYVGKRRLERALARVPEIDVEVHWKPFRLDPTIPPEGISREAYLAILNGKVKLSTISDAMHAYPTLSEINKNATVEYLVSTIPSWTKKLTKFLFGYQGKT